MSSVEYNNGFIIGLSINKMSDAFSIYNRSGVFTPFFGSQQTIDQTILTINLFELSLSQIKLKFESTPVADKEAWTGEFKIEYTSDEVTSEETLLNNVQVNFARNYQAWRGDVAMWELTKSGSDTTFKLYFYNHIGTKTWSGKSGVVKNIDLKNSNCIHYVLNN